MSPRQFGSSLTRCSSKKDRARSRRLAFFFFLYSFRTNIITTRQHTPSKWFAYSGTEIRISVVYASDAVGRNEEGSRLEKYTSRKRIRAINLARNTNVDISREQYFRMKSLSPRRVSRRDRDLCVLIFLLPAAEQSAT